MPSNNDLFSEEEISDILASIDVESEYNGGSNVKDPSEIAQERIKAVEGESEELSDEPMQIDDAETGGNSVGQVPHTTRRHMLGWECPKCNRILSPLESECVACNSALFNV